MHSAPETVAVTPKVKAVRIELPNDNLLQALRFVHALSEGDFELSVQEETFKKMEFLRHFFPLNLRVSHENEPIITDFEINHQLPLTRLGSIRKPLIFPHAYFTYLRGIWNSERTTGFSFSGLLTPSRIAVLNAWLQFQHLRCIPRWTIGSLFKAALKRAHVASFTSTERRFARETSHGLLTITSSENGRSFPGKVWDDAYFRHLANSKFVLCPAGDYVWTYRFFEAAMCGAIPIVEESCDSYRDFKFFRMDQPIEALSWSPDIAEHNFSTCRQYLTVSRTEMNREVTQMFAER
jgi:hypothetical protein